MKRMYIDNPLRVLSATGTIPEGVPARKISLDCRKIYTFRFREMDAGIERSARLAVAC
jgi:hypothetical protein